MKKQLLSFVLVATMIGSIATGCSSRKDTGSSSDSTAKDTAKMSRPASAPGNDTTKKDSARRDTTHH